MKQIYFFILSLLVFAGCSNFPYGKVISQYDDFKQESKQQVLFKEKFKSIETNIPSLNRTKNITFKFENIAKDNYEDLNLLVFTFDLAPAEYTDSIFFILADKKLFELKFEDIVSSSYIRRTENHSTTTSTNTTTETKNNENNQSVSTKNSTISSAKHEPKTITKTETSVTNDTNISESSRKTVVNKAIISDIILNNIIMCKSLTLRVYINERGYNYEFSELNLQKLKKLTL